MAGEPAESERLDPALVRLALILLTGVMAVVFDTTIVNVAIDTLGHDLHTSVATTQWVVSAYVLALGLVIPVSGWAMQRFGAKQLWMIALILFLVGSILSSLAWNIGSLIAFRVLQGGGGGLMLPILQTLLVDAAGGRRLGRMMALVSIPALLGPILGPVLGGLIISHLSWRWIFWVNVPFCCLGLLLAWRGLQPTAPSRASQLDGVGLALLSPALAAIIYGLSEVGRTGGFAHAAVIAPLAGGVVFLGLFTFHALRTSRIPVVDLRLFTVRSFSASAILLFLSGMTLYSAMLLLPLYYQQVRGHSALATGLLLAPQGLGMLLTRRRAGALTDRIGPRPVVLGGFVLTAIGTFAYTQSGTHTNEVVLGLSLIVRGAGLGAVIPPVMAAAYLGLRPDQVPHASSATRIMQQVGGSFGTAVLAVILQTQITAHRGGGLAGRAAAFDNAFWWSLGFTALAIVPAVLLPGRRDRDRPAQSPEPTAAVPAAPDQPGAGSTSPRLSQPDESVR
jgi:EmrB/QacA subfamily drug resistance transporter